MWHYVVVCVGMWWYVVWYVVVFGGMWWYVAVCAGMWWYVVKSVTRMSQMAEMGLKLCIAKKE